MSRTATINAQVRLDSFGILGILGIFGIFIAHPHHFLEVLFSNLGYGYHGVIPGHSTGNRIKAGGNDRVGVYSIPLFLPPE